MILLESCNTESKDFINTYVKDKINQSYQKIRIGLIILSVIEILTIRSIQRKVNGIINVNEKETKQKMGHFTIRNLLYNSIILETKRFVHLKVIKKGFLYFV